MASGSRARSTAIGMFAVVLAFMATSVIAAPGDARAREQDRGALEVLERAWCRHRGGVDRSRPHRI